MTPAAFLIAWVARSAALILTGALLIRLVRATNPSLRIAAWTALLIGSLSIPLLNTALPELPLRLLPAASTQPVETIAAPSVDHGVPPPVDVYIASTPLDPSPAKPVDWIRLALIAYVAISAALLMRLLIGLALGIRILRRSSPTGLPAAPGDVRESGEIESPVTAGIIRPAVLLPSDWREWDGPRLNAVLAHERSHIRRRDPALQFISSLHCALLWISPPSWLLHRAIVRTGEEISDEDAVTVLPDRAAYAEILLDFMQRRARPHFAGVAMASYEEPKTRIRRILNATAGATRATRAGIVSIVAVIVPLSCLSAVIYPGHSSRQLSAPIRAEAPPGLPAAPSLVNLAQATPPRFPSPPANNTEALPQFEAATIKPAPPGGMMGVRCFQAEESL